MVTILNSFLNYFLLTKPKLTALLLLTALVEALSVYNGNAGVLLALILSVFLSCSGVNAITAYLDRDIDAIMSRTKHRPVPRKAVREKNALIFGTLLLIVGLALASLINIYVLFWGIVGAAFVLSYNYKLKRLTPYNILIASPGGAAPLLGAYSAMTSELISLQSFLLAMLIVFWTPVHIWSLAAFYREDYRKAGVPMLPVVKDREKVINAIAVFTSLYVLTTFAVFSTLSNDAFSLSIVALLNYPLVKLLLKLSDAKAHYKLFKLSNPHLGIVFILYLFLSVGWW